MIRLPRSVGALAALAALGAPLLAAPAHGQDELALDPTRFAVRSDATPGGAARPLPIDGWWLVESPHRVAISTAMRGAVERGARFATPVLVGEHGGPVVPTPELLVGLVPEFTGEDARAWLHQRTGGAVEARWPGANAYRVVTDLDRGEDVLALCADLAEHPLVRWAEPDAITSGGGAGTTTPDDPFFADLWGLENTGQFGGIPGIDLGALECWDLTRGSTDVPVVVLDVGVQSTHPDLFTLPGADFTHQGPAGGEPRSVCDLHGTLVAGTISAMLGNGVGVVGIAPESPVVSARCFVADTGSCNGSWFARVSWTADALQWTQMQGYRITNNSNFYNFPSQTVEAVYAATRAAGSVHFAACGNFGAQGLTWPARVDGVVSVGAITSSGARTSFSNFGPELDLMAPGQLVRTTDLTGPDGLDPGDYEFAVGTSVAAPYVAGVAALLLTLEPGLSPQEVEDRLVASAVDLDVPGRDDRTGWGRVFAPRALVPCEAPATVCLATANSTGNAARIDALRPASRSSGLLRVDVDGGVPGEPGVWFYGPDVVQTPFANGVLCAGGGSLGLFRAPTPVVFDGAGSAVSVLDLENGPFAAGPGAWTLGSSWTLQLYYRDPAAGGARANLSDAVRLTVCP